MATKHPICYPALYLQHQLVKKHCKWVWLTDAKFKEHMDAYAAKIKNGIVVGYKGKLRKKWAPATKDVEEVEPEEENEGEEEDSPRCSHCLMKGKYKSTAFIDDEAEESDGEGGTHKWNLPFHQHNEEGLLKPEGGFVVGFHETGRPGVQGFKVNIGTCKPPQVAEAYVLLVSGAPAIFFPVFPFQSWVLCLHFGPFVPGSEIGREKNRAPL
ncbi:hypothetical protein F5887DRAFT_924779 [Amanita rubescens]|nr:hypothetical protein F5887DRAFT_924779 [Amanita rubescens]